MRETSQALEPAPYPYGVRGCGSRGPNFTMQLNVHFISGTKQGDFLGAEDEVMRVTQSVVYVRGRLIADDRLIAHADGV